MTTADELSTAATTPGQRYILTIVNGSLSTVSPLAVYSGGTFPMPAAVNSNTALAVPTLEVWKHEFVASTNGISLATSDGGVLWSLHPVLP